VSTATYSKTASHGVFSAAQEQMGRMTEHFSSRESFGATHAELEDYVVREGRELQRLLVQAHLELRAERERPVEVRGADGVARTHRRKSGRPLRLVVGVVDVERLAYQARDVCGLHPADAALNLPHELYSHGVRRVAAEEAAKCSYDEVVEAVAKRTGEPLPKRQVEQLAVRAAVDFEVFYKERCRSLREDTKDLLVLTFDGKGVVMRHEDLRPATKKAAAKAKRKLSTRLTKGEKRNRKRMAEVAAVYTVPPWIRTPMDILHELRPLRDTTNVRPQVRNKRVWASLTRTPREVINEAFRDALARDPDRRRRWVVLVDGNKDQLARVKAAAKKVGVTVTIVVDLIHVLEYLWRAAHVFHGDGNKLAEGWVQQRLMWLLQGRPAGKIASALRVTARAAELEDKELAVVNDTADYLQEYARYMHYGQAIRDGLPIATGVIEGACRYLVKDRMGRTGARWSLKGGEAVLRLRALRASGDFDAYWAFHLERERARNHDDRYEGQRAPDPTPRLRSVKSLGK
jgi:hypothetical protein